MCIIFIINKVRNEYNLNRKKFSNLKKIKTFNFININLRINLLKIIR